MSNATYRETYQPYAQDAARAAGIPEDLFLALITQESGWNPSAESPAGALGIAQFMPGTAADYGIDPLNPIQSLYAAAEYLKRSAQHFGVSPLQYDASGAPSGSWKSNSDGWAKVIASYNAGIGGVENAIKQGVKPTGSFIGDLTLGAVGDMTGFQGEGAWKSHLPDETQSFIDIILGTGPGGMDFQSRAAAAEASATSTQRPTTSPVGSGRVAMPNAEDYWTQDFNGNWVFDSATYNNDLMTAKQLQDYGRNQRLGMLSGFFQDTLAQIDLELQLGQMDLAKATEEIRTRLDTFQTVTNALPELLKYAIPNSGFAPGREPGGFWEERGLPSSQPQTIKYNPFQEAAAINSFASSRLDQVPGVTTQLPQSPYANEIENDAMAILEAMRSVGSSINSALTGGQ